MTAQKRSRAEARRSDDGQEHVEGVHNAHDDRSTTRKHSDALHAKLGHLVVRAWDMTSMQCSNPSNPWGNIKINTSSPRLHVVGTDVSDVAKNTHTDTQRARNENLTDFARPTYDPWTREKATTMELKRHHDGDELCCTQRTLFISLLPPDFS